MVCPFFVTGRVPQHFYMFGIRKRKNAGGGEKDMDAFEKLKT